MKTLCSRARRAALPHALTAVFPVFAALPALSQTEPFPVLAETVVTATRSAQPVGDVVADVTIIEGDVIERSAAVGIADILARVPGIEMARNGGTGSNTSVFIRGGETRHTAVLVDGVRIDSQTTSGGVNWAAIPLSQIERIEIVRGPTSAVYGSDAVAGVIQIFTKKGQSAFAPAISYGVGSYGTQKMDFSASGSAGAVDYSLGLSGASSRGFNARPGVLINPDADGYSSNSANAKVGFQINASHRLEASVLQSRLDAQYDGGTPPLSLIRDYHRVSKLKATGLQWKAKWTDQYSSTVAVNQSTDRGEESIGGAVDQTRINNVLWQNEYKLGAHLFSATLENSRTEFLLTTAPSVYRTRSQTGAGLGYGWSGGPHTVQFNIRRDSDSEFGGKSTGSAAYAYALTSRWKVSASAGTSYRVPTLYQRFSQYGVATLVPESGKNLEFGLKYAEGSNAYGVAVYRNRLTNLLSFLSGASAATCPSPVLGCYANIATAQYQGVTFTASKTLGPSQLHASLDLQSPKDLTTGRQLARRSRQHATFGVDTRVAGWSLSGDVLLSATRFDDITANPVVLPGYALLNLSASTALSRDWKLLFKLDNATDTVYQTANTYAQAKRTLYVGLAWAPL